MKSYTLKKRRFLIGFIIVVTLIVGGGFLYAGFFAGGIDNLALRGYTIEIESQGGDSEKETKPKPQYPSHPLAGISCKNYNKRPFAVMMPIDEDARPLSAISKADIVVEVPVVKDKATRLMALFACTEPDEIGSVRSSRKDFISIAAGFDAIYSHWGGSKHALDTLKTGVIDNIDALVNPYNVYYRKPSFPRPHNGFTSYSRLVDTSKRLGYRTEINTKGYPHKKEGAAKKEDAPRTVSIGYPDPYSVSYIYNREENAYYKHRGGRPEKDALDGSQVKTRVVAILETTSQMRDDQYNNIKEHGSGDAIIFQDGEMIRGKWEKPEEPFGSRIRFYNEDGDEIRFRRGRIWMHYVDEGTTVRFGNNEV